MHRIDGATAYPDNKFGMGDPQNAVPATKVHADWLNDIQENLAVFIEAQGIVLEKGNYNQLAEAVLKAQGTFQDSTLKKTIQNNRVAWTDLADMLFDKTQIKSVLFRYDLQRTSSTTDLLEGGSFRISVKSGSWIMIPGVSGNDDSGVEWNVDSVTGQVQYKSTPLDGTDYVGNVYLKLEKYLL